MNLQPSNRRQDLPVRLGTHGYRLDGDYAVLNAELHVPPYFSDSSVGLELWACPAPHAGGTPEGVKIAEVSLDLPTPIGPHVQRVEARAAINPPPGSGDHAMVLVLVGGNADARRVHDFANYGRLQHFDNPQLDGAVAYSIESDEVVLNVANVSNPRPEGNSSGSLRLELWASAEPHAGGTPRGHRLAAADLGSVWGQYQLPNVSRRVTFTPPPPGRWHVSLLLREWTLAGSAPRDYRNFDVVYVQPGAVPQSPPPAAARPADKVRLLKPAPSVENTPATPTLEAPVALAPVEEVPAAAAVAPAHLAPAAEAPAALAPTAEVVAAAAPVEVTPPPRSPRAENSRSTPRASSSWPSCRASASRWPRRSSRRVRWPRSTR